MKRLNPLALITGMLLWATPVLAGPAIPPGAFPDALPNAGPGTTLTLSGIITTVTDGITMLLGLAITIAIGMIVYGGFKMATSRGADADYKKGKDIVYNAIIGLTVMLATGLIINTIGRFAVNPGSILY